MILTAESKEKIEKHNPDPHNRYSVTDDLSLHIKSVSLSDSGIYYCNANPTVNLTVTSGENRASSNLRHPDSTPTTDLTTAYSSDYKPAATTDPIYSPPEHTATTPDSSTRTAFTSYCIKENK
ncbi:hypothetical protein IRJ41_006949 [Triplophysa rosa]|nr:hypothetical protein IRJ41_006949 [Triplophysa rosa]